MHNWTKWITDLQALAQNGLAYTQNPFDVERFQRIQQISAEMLEHITEIPHEKISGYFAQESGYATPKLDVRGAVFREDKILLVRERADQRWSLPGGWADVNESAAECTVKEIYEESGYLTKAIKLAALYDRQKHPHPCQWPHIFKAFFICELTGGAAKENLEISEIDFFPLDALPELSLPRVTEWQISRMFAHWKNPELPTEFD
jgi:ADP-ribose pyrophosphatase YjhB (NUDIX family)